VYDIELYQIVLVTLALFVAMAIAIATLFFITDLRDHKCNRPNVVGKDEDYCCRRCVNIL
jgi:hypothetical protein